MVGLTIQAEILRLTPQNFKHYFGMHLYHFAMLDFSVNDASCDYAQKYLKDDDPPQIDTMKEIIRKMNSYDLGRTMLDPTPLVANSIAVVSVQDKINRSNNYWHQRFNTDPCFDRVGLKDFVGNGDHQNTPGGVQTFVQKIDYRKALACGGHSKTSDCDSPAIEQLPLSDPRAKALHKEMFDKHDDLRKHRYPFDPIESTVPVPTPAQ